MKVVYIHHSTYFGGSSKSLGLAIQELVKLGVEPHIICPRGSVVDYFRNITSNVYTLSHRSFPLTMTIVNKNNEYFHFIRNLRNLLYAKRVQKIIDQINPDIVHCNEWGLVDIAKKAKQKGYKVVMHARTMPEPSYSFINNYAFKRIRKYVDHLICISGSVNNALKVGDKKSTIYNPLEVIGRENYQIKENGENIKVMSLSAIQKNKGVFDILESAKDLEEYKNIRFFIAGSTNQVNYKSLSISNKIKFKLGLINNDGNKFSNKLEEYKLTNVTLLGHVDNIYSELDDADILLAPMHLNAPPRSVFEAGILGIPSILAMKDVVEDIIENGKTGIIIMEKRPDELSKAILELVNNPEKRIEIGTNAQKLFKVNHDPKLVGIKILEVYQNLLQVNE